MSTISLADLNAQIEQLEAQRAELQAKAEVQRKEAMSSIVEQLIEQITTYGITAKELGLQIGKAAKAKPGRKSLGAKIAHNGKTFTGPNGQTWTEGTRGRKPQWVSQEQSKIVDSAAN